MRGHQLVIKGETPLHGIIEVKGSKNAALAILASIFVCSGTATLRNVPDISDVRIKLELLRGYGAIIDWQGDVLHIDCSNISYFVPDEDTVRHIRTSFYMLGPVLARLGKVKIPMPGGCKIGARPVDYHLKGLEKMGAKVELVNGCYVASCDRLVGAEIYFDFPSAGATQHLMATATLAEGCTVIDNAAMEPEVEALGRFLIACGARIEGLGTARISIHGVKSLGPCTFRVPADRIQAGTYLMAGAITKGSVTVTGIDPLHQAAVLSKMQEAGIEIDDSKGDQVTATYVGRTRGIRVKTMPYPGFPTDMQQPMCAILTLSAGQSTIEESVYESRTGHVDELLRMGANIKAVGRNIEVIGVPKLSGATVYASDLRAGAALVLAGLAAEGTTIVRNIDYIDRGYQDLEKNLTSLGAKIERVSYEARDGLGDVAHDLH